MELALKVVKSAALLGTAGIALALVAPYIAMAIGVSSPAAGYVAAQQAIHLSANPAWLGLFFGAFGAIDAALQPVFQKIFPLADDVDSKTSAAIRQAQGTASCPEHECTHSNHVDYEMARRAADTAKYR